MKKLALILIILSLSSCVDQSERYKTLKQKFPTHRIEPGSRQYGRTYYDFILYDTSGNIYGLDFYPFSTTKVANFHRIQL